MSKNRRGWFFSPPKAVKLKVPNYIKINVMVEANKLIDAVLKPTHINSAGKDNHSTYIVDIYSKWYRNYFYFCSKYACPGPNAISPYFEAKFARLEYAGNERFNLAYMRHTGQWWEIFSGLSLAECLEAIKDGPHFLP